MGTITESELLGVRKALYNHAYKLCKDPSNAEDLVQDTLVKAISKQHLFQDGTNLKGWLFTILKNEWFTKIRKNARMVEDVEGHLTNSLVAPDNQLAAIEAREIIQQVRYLPGNYRKALIAVAIFGGSYEEAAQHIGVSLGTIKSMINRAREQLATGVFQDISEEEFEAPPQETEPDNTKWHDTIRILYVNENLDISEIAAKTKLSKVEILDAVNTMQLKRKKVKTP